ncbi:kinesin-like protein Kar3p [Monosporozyma servazzii]
MSNIPTTPERNQSQAKRRYTTSPSPKVYRNGIPTISSVRDTHGETSNSPNIDRRSLDGQTNITSTGIKSIISRMPSSLHGPTSTTMSLGGSGNRTNHLTSFYNEQMKELNQLQDTLVKKKAKLDELRDIVSNGKEEFNETKLRWDKLRDSKVAKEQQLKVKQNEMAKLKETIEARRNFLEEGHKLHLQQMEVENQTKINKLINEYKEKIEALKKTKIKKFEDERDNLSREVDSIKAKIDNNDEALKQLMKELDEKYDKIKEDWLNEYQLEWKKNIKINEDYFKEIDEINKDIEENLKPKKLDKEKELNRLKEKIVDVEKILHDRRDKKSHLEAKIKERQIKLSDNKERQEELKQYINKTESDLKEINDILMKEETLRRSLHNELQELRGNIRVFCRIRPPLPKIEDPDTSHIKVDRFDDDNGIQTMEVIKSNSYGTGNGNSIKPQQFKFDKIFDIGEPNTEVFKEVGQLVQSSLDGYNVCIFAYGQTGSGKTFTMLNPGDGIIPSTISHIFSWIENLKERGWEYKIECQFVEIYNENIVDLLRNSNGENNSTGNGKCEVRHDHENETTTITNVTTCQLDSKETVGKILQRATKLRSTASTESNEHSSRSHSIFIIHLYGHNNLTNENSHGILNLVDLAGSERIHSSQVSGDRLRETQNINKSLSCLGDVIHALNTPDRNGKRHVPFRNSKLTYLLQYSLTGNSKTLMFVNISPSNSHLNETVNSLRFASKVNSTKIGK